MQAKQHLPERPSMVDEASWAMMKNLDRMFVQTFKAFCSAEHDTLDFASFRKLCKHCFLIDGRLSEADVGSIFDLSASPGAERLTFVQFEAALELLARKRGLSTKVLRSDIALCGGPSPNGKTRGKRGSKKVALLGNLKDARLLLTLPKSPIAVDVSTEADETHDTLRMKAQDALFEALFGGDSSAPPPQSPSQTEAPDPDPNLALRIKAQTALVEALCGDEEQEEELKEPIKVNAALRLKAQQALVNALQMQECSQEDPDVDHDAMKQLKARACDALHKAMHHIPVEEDEPPTAPAALSQ